MRVARRIAIVVNPVSGRGRGAERGRALAERLREAGHAVTVHETRQSGDATRLAAAASGAAEIIAIVGGDGTVNEVVNGMQRPLPLLLCPTGTANVLAGELGCPLDIESIAWLADHGFEVTLDAGEANGRRFLLMASAGFDAAVVHQLARLRRGAISMATYAGPVCRTVVDYAMPPVRLRVDGRELPGAASTVVIANVAGYAGLFRVDPAATAEDGRLNAVRFRARSRWRLVVATLAMACGAHTRLPDVDTAVGAEFELFSEADVPVQLDGEAAGFLPLRLRVLPRALRVLAPRPGLGV